MHQWLFCFQRSIALVLSKLLSQSSPVEKSDFPPTSPLFRGTSNREGNVLNYDTKQSPVSLWYGFGKDHSDRNRGSAVPGVVEYGNRPRNPTSPIRGVSSVAVAASYGGQGAPIERMSRIQGMGRNSS